MKYYCCVYVRIPVYLVQRLLYILFHSFIREGAEEGHHKSSWRLQREPEDTRMDIGKVFSPQSRKSFLHFSKFHCVRGRYFLEKNYVFHLATSSVKKFSKFHCVHLISEFFIYCSFTWCIRSMIMHGFLFPISEFQEGIESFHNSCESRVLDSSNRTEMIIEGCSKGLLSYERNSPLYPTLFMSYIYQFLCVNPFYKLLNNRKYSYARLQYPMAMKTFTSI